MLNICVQSGSQIMAQLDALLLHVHTVLSRFSHTIMDRLSLQFYRIKELSFFQIGNKSHDDCRCLHIIREYLAWEQTCGFLYEYVEASETRGTTALVY